MIKDDAKVERQKTCLVITFQELADKSAIMQWWLRKPSDLGSRKDPVTSYFEDHRGSESNPALWQRLCGDAYRKRYEHPRGQGSFEGEGWPERTKAAQARLATDSWRGLGGAAETIAARLTALMRLEDEVTIQCYTRAVNVAAWNPSYNELTQPYNLYSESSAKKRRASMLKSEQDDRDAVEGKRELTQPLSRDLSLREPGGTLRLIRSRESPGTSVDSAIPLPDAEGTTASNPIEISDW